MSVLVPICGVLFVTNETASLVVQLVAICAAGAAGAACRPSTYVPLAIAGGIAANALGQIVLAGGGPGACVGFVLLPSYCVGSAATGAILARLVRGKSHAPGQCQRCGYDLTGNVSGRCPECGDRIESDDA
jgi:hypothetical protein